MIKKLSIDYKKYIDSMENKDFVLIDPPWNYDNKDTEFTSRTNFSKITDNVEFLNYMFANVKSKIILLWITSPLLGYFFDTKDKIDTKAFKYKQMLTWVKTKNDGSLYEGPGFWFKNSCEFMILFVNKNVKPIRSRIPNYCEEKATRSDATTKPKTYESFILRELYNSGHTNGSYIFSGTYEDYDISKNQNIDLIDVLFNGVKK